MSARVTLAAEVGVGDDASLVERFVRRDPAAFECVLAMYQGRVARLAQRLLGWAAREGEVDDVVQEVFLAAWEKAGRFRGDSALWTWLTAITLNRCRTHQRKRWLRKLVSLREAAAEAPAACRKAEDDEDSRHVRLAVARLPERDREVIVLFYLEQWPVAKIATLLGLRENAVSVRLNRARARLREKLTELGVEP
jgi:RNA polymerase sigma-70 factor (ECF subfamily)